MEGLAAAFRVECGAVQERPAVHDLLDLRVEAADVVRVPFGAVRAVGTALGHNPVPFLIPCHRVVRSDGSLGEYSGGGPAVKERVLALEGCMQAPPSRGTIVVGVDLTSDAAALTTLNGIRYAVDRRGPRTPPVAKTAASSTR